MVHTCSHKVEHMSFLTKILFCINRVFKQRACLICDATEETNDHFFNCPKSGNCCLIIKIIETLNLANWRILNIPISTQKQYKDSSCTLASEGYTGLLLPVSLLAHLEQEK